MFTIETPYGKFTGGSMKDAQKLARAAEREADKRRKAEQPSIDRAGERAEVMAFRFVKRKHNGNQVVPSTCLFLAPGTAGSFVEYTGLHATTFRKDTIDGGTEGWEFRHTGYHMIGAYIRPCGTLAGFALRNPDIDGPAGFEFYAVGSCNGHVRYELVPTITAADLPKAEVS